MTEEKRSVTQNATARKRGRASDRDYTVSGTRSVAKKFKASPVASPAEIWAQDLLADKLALKFKDRRVRGCEIHDAAKTWCRANKVQLWWEESAEKNKSAKSFHQTTTMLRKEYQGNCLWYFGYEEPLKTILIDEEFENYKKEGGTNAYFEIEEILEQKKIHGQMYVLVHWRGYDDSKEHTWEPSKQFQKIAPIWNAWLRRKRENAPKKNKARKSKQKQRSERGEPTSRQRQTNNSVAAALPTTPLPIASLPTALLPVAASPPAAVSPPPTATPPVATTPPASLQAVNTSSAAALAAHGLLELSAGGQRSLSALDAEELKSLPPPDHILSAEAASLASTIVTLKSGRLFRLDGLIRGLVAEFSRPITEACLMTKRNLLELEKSLLRGKDTLGELKSNSQELILTLQAARSKPVDKMLVLNIIRRKIAALDDVIAKIVATQDLFKADPPLPALEHQDGA